MSSSGVTRARCRRGDERGVFLVLWSVVLVTVMVVTALVIDLGQQRVTRRDLQSIVDLAGLAAGSKLTNSDPLGACADAWTYLSTNAPELPTAGVSVDCSGLGTAAACNNVNPVPHDAVVLGVTSPFTVRIRYPVPDSEITRSTFASGKGVLDGKPCQRIKVGLERTRPSFFASILGIGSFKMSASAVVRANGSSSRLPPALWFLDPHGCTALSVSGGSHLTLGTTGVPGVLVSDSDGTSCTGSQVTVSSSGAGTLLQTVPQGLADLSANGSINLYAMPPGSTACSDALHHDCSASDVTAGRLVPQPVGLPTRSTRAPVDWRYNCKANYPTFHGVSIGNCPDNATVPAYIDRLRAAVGVSGAPSASYQRWSTTYGCSPSGTVVAAGNWWVDCRSFTLNGGASVEFTGGNVVFDGDVSVTSGTLKFNTTNPSQNLPSACLPDVVTTPCIDQSSGYAAFVYVRNGGNLSTSGGSAITFKRTSLVQTTSGANGYFSFTGNSPPVWSAPIEGPFSNLAAWSETSTNKYQITGGSNMDLKGVFFTPEATPFSLSGGSPVSQQNAQFITYQLAVSGGANLTMAPQPNEAISYLPPNATLIR